MTCQLPIDCLNEIFEYLEEDSHTLYSCLLVNHLWCEISVRILWRYIWNSKEIYSIKMPTSILNTLIACLPNESKKLLHENKIFISTPTSKPPLFNYAAFCKVLSIDYIYRLVNSRSLKDGNHLVVDEIVKMFAKQIYSLKKLVYCNEQQYVKFSLPYFPGISDLSELHCSSSLSSNFFYWLSQLCHNLQSISISFYCDASDELKELISLQNNLKSLTLSSDEGSWKDIVPILTKHSHTITRLRLYSDNRDLPYSFISLFTNLQEFVFSYMDGSIFEDFKMLQYVKFSKLQSLNIPYQCPKPEYVMKFLENNGKNLKKFHTDESNKGLSLSIPNFCPNLKSLFVIFYDGESDVLKNIFIKCQYLESIKIWCGDGFLSEKEVFETVANYSSDNFCELKIYNESCTHVISSKDLESFFINWNNRISKKLLTLTIIKENDIYAYLHNNDENMKIIEKYKNLGIVRINIITYEDESREEEDDYYFYN
ncbi:hypothetical protein RclHR1_18350002 [Rhizophagus clarus]|uniref:F-box domain-containing protein n=1 Tax=Rhizophagus clarus TaxID=94130 RepID=A0A2Z6RFD0_9GLOM|nr:hypothetical protein RclHR1_18350002 [Rhizophagus clarus]GES83632.1 hypothetical protein GLOIN_2v1876445 [Rhizophagus clarus]